MTSSGLAVPAPRPAASTAALSTATSAGASCGRTQLTPSPSSPGAWGLEQEVRRRERAARRSCRWRRSAGGSVAVRAGPGDE